MRRFLLAVNFLCFFTMGTVFAQKSSVENSTETGAEKSKLEKLLSGYLANDLLLQKYTLTAQSKLLSWDSTKINNGINLTLSTGNVKIQASENGNQYNFSPTVTLNLPQVNDTSITGNLPITKQSGYLDETKNGTFLDNGSVKVSTGILSSAKEKRNVALLEAERSYREAVRNMEKQALTAEKEFYENLKKIYGYASSVLTKRVNLHDDELDLKVLTVQGYSKTSSAYRSKLLKCQSDRRDVHVAERQLERETAVFAVKCDSEYKRVFDNSEKSEKTETSGNKDIIEETGSQAFKSVMAFLPSEIPSVKMEDVLSYGREKYSKIESSEWTKYINDLKRSYDYKAELKAYGGYTFNESTSGSDTIDGGLTFDWHGISASAGVSFPTGDNVLPFDSSKNGSKKTDPVYTVSLSLTPNTWRLAEIDRQQDSLEKQVDEITVKSAADDYEADVLSKLTERGDLLWTRRSYREEFDMYKKLAEDSENWLKQGIITESDYLDAVNNRDKAQINLLVNSVDQMIYNNEVKLLFTGDSV